MAALSIEFPSEMRRRCGKTSVRRSLTFASQGAELQYLMNGGRYIARNRMVQMCTGTTGCEATHAELVRFFSDVRMQTARHACAWTGIFNLRKLAVGMAQRLPTSKVMSAGDHLRAMSTVMLSSKVPWGDRMDIRAKPLPIIDVESLPPNATVSASHRGRAYKARIGQ